MGIAGVLLWLVVTIGIPTKSLDFTTTTRVISVQRTATASTLSRRVVLRAPAPWWYELQSKLLKGGDIWEYQRDYRGLERHEDVPIPFAAPHTLPTICIMHERSSSCNHRNKLEHNPESKNLNFESSNPPHREPPNPYIPSL